MRYFSPLTKRPGHSSSLQGFTLMELSLVLVVVGIVIGAIVSGQHLLHTMRLSKILEEQRTYETAVMMFSEKYRELPGDMGKATDYWGALSWSGGCADPRPSRSGNSFPSGEGKATCDGNHDGIINDWYVDALWHESFRAWEHLYLADLVSRSFTGVSGSSSVKDAEVGVNIPSGPLSGTGWTFARFGNHKGDTSTNDAYHFMNRSYGNSLLFGREMDGMPAIAAALTPGEARQLDLKVDDGSPYTGKISALLRGTNTQNCTNEGWNSASPSANTDKSASDSTYYNTDSEQVACSLIFEFPMEIQGPL